MTKEKIRVLVVEDEEDIVEMISYNLQKEGYRTLAAFNGEEAINKANKERPDLIILDLMLPGIDGLEVCKLLRQQKRTAQTPIIMLTAKSQDADKVIGLELGADDYITKPFSPRELTARIKAVLRRYKITPASKNITLGPFALDNIKHKITISGKEIALTLTEFKILEYMLQQPGTVLSREKILNHVFGYESTIYDRTVDAHIKSLRKKVGSARSYIETIRGIGYRLKEY